MRDTRADNVAISQFLSRALWVASSRRLPIGVVAVIIGLLTGQQTIPAQSFADKAADKTAPSNTKSATNGLGFEQQSDRIRITQNGQAITDFVFRDEKILRPYFANARLPDGRQITRNHPPIAGVDAVDHDTMHPGIWLGFGDISGHDFWRNKAAFEHVRFVTPPRIHDGKLQFATECRLKPPTGEPLGQLVNEFTIVERPQGWLLVWRAAFRAEKHDIVFGDQEEMGFGARVATGSTEKKGGVIKSSTGKKSASQTWGQPAAWCDYSGTDGRSGGILLMASPKNFRESWWHNRDYGVFVANPFGRAAMKQGAPSAIRVTPSDSLRLAFGAMIHDERPIEGSAEFTVFQQISEAE